ncbi:ATP-dependent endonuclease [Belnapia sp. F-4-1]|uniref:ATP-dependent nuclease n=1 Tax=Belnapia sp. F-4-1 TaxID=1545443 RepID=UPI0009DFB744|nr:AAA family ATPase [Belnapia sp. F-4-1]
MAAITHPVSIALPVPWKEQNYVLPPLLPLTFLVGPNGSGKSRFAESLKNHLQTCRLLGTDRLDGMQRNRGLGVYGDNFAEGLPKQYFQHFQSFSLLTGSGIDTIPLLAERLDIRVKVEATLSHLFDRTISLEWNSGNLMPKAFLGVGGAAYRLDSDECHGIKELLVMLTHLYNDESQFLIIDEPELNLHPQFQAFFMQEVRKVAGNPKVEPGKKGIILITHSPFILDFRSIFELQSVISFSIDHLPPRNLLTLDQRSIESLTTLVSRINVHHKQFFFSDNPVFVEGIFDSQIIQAIQDARDVSVPGAGSCIIEAGGCDEVNKYLLLCEKLGKKAFFIYDLDSLFTGTLRGCIRNDTEVSSFLSSLGLGSDFSQYCGDLDRVLTKMVKDFIAASANLELKDVYDNSLAGLLNYLKKLPVDNNGNYAGEALQRARIAVLVQLARDQDALGKVFPAQRLSEVNGRLKQIANALAQKNVLLLTKGALENYLPSYDGNPFRIDEGQKRRTVEKEILYLSSKPTDDELFERYGELLENIKKLPAKEEVNFDEFLMPILGQLILDFQQLTLKRPLWSLDQMRAQLFQAADGRGRIFEIDEFERGAGTDFAAKIVIKPGPSVSRRHVIISHKTNAGMRDFKIINEGEPSS